MLSADRRPIRDILWLIIAIGLSSTWCLTAAQRLGATFDEPIYLQRGLEGWRTGSHRGLLKLGTMPLPADVQTLPLYIIECERGRQWDLQTEFATALFIARAMTLPFWWLLLVYSWRAGRMMAGSWGGNLAVTILACEPNLLAHASLATTDIALTACLLAFLVHYRKGRNGTLRQRVIVPGIWYGIAVSAKASALVFGPLCMVAIEIERAFVDRSKERIWAFCRESIQIGCLGLAITFAFCGCDWQTEPSFVAWAHGLPEGSAKPAMTWIADHLRIFSNAGEGLARQIKHNLRGHGVYLLGTASDHAIWYYFPVLFTIKLAIPLLIAPIALLMLRGRALRNWAVAAGVTLFLFSFNCRVQIGIRLLLPCVALIAIGLAAAIVTALRDLGPSRAVPMLRISVVATVGWMFVGTLAAWPDGLRYVNEFWAGRKPGYEIVSDSNYDWGQGLPELAVWKSQHGVADLDVWYFGTDPRLTGFQFHELPLHALPSGDVRERVSGRLLAVGTSILYGHGLTESHRRAAAYLRTCRPIDRTSTFLIFDFKSHSPELARRPVAETHP
jgi:hypothetical protein